MKILFVHQNFPAQFAGLVDTLASLGDVEVAAIGQRDWRGRGVRYKRYAVARPETSYDFVIDEFAAKTAIARAAAAQARLLKLEGFLPDVVIVHPGWGEALFLRDLFPKAKLVVYCEYYYARHGTDLGFDPEFPVPSEDVLHRLRARNAILLAALDDADMGVAPTFWQRSTFPVGFQDRIVVVHEGVDREALGPLRRAPLELPTIDRVPQNAPIVTYSARCLEPMRGFHTFLRAVPRMHARHPDLHVIVAGGESGGYGPPPEEGGTWKDRMLAEVGDAVDASRLHFVGWLDRHRLTTLMRWSSCHVYLTYPFVLSWSLIEAMVLRVPILASATPPVEEFLVDAEHARLVDFFDADALAAAAIDLVQDRALGRRLGRAAARRAVERGLHRRHASKAWLALLRSL